VTRVGRSRTGARKVCLLLLVSVAFLPFGVPRWLNHDAPPVSSHADGNFSTLCLDHGGTPRTTRARGTTTKARSCTVRYGRHAYVMDAITPGGFDEDTARYQRRGCDEARREERASNAPRRRRSFIYHPTTGVCERRS
jgi:hypothetical protein